MPSVDAASPNPKSKKKNKPRAIGSGVPALPPEEAHRRRRLVWYSSIGVILVIVLVWFANLSSILAPQRGSSPAWDNFKSRISDLFNFSSKSKDEIKKIDPDSPTPDQVQKLREEIFPMPASNVNLPTSGENSNAPVNTNVNVSGAINTNAVGNSNQSVTNLNTNGG
jgi:hypothetical protein